MTVQATKMNTDIRNISWFNGYNATQPISAIRKSNYAVSGNPNKPEVLNDNPNAGVVRTFDSYKCFGYENC